ncbi:flavodoxin family protein [Deltaproteobacteria bacterium Smac51]|nr:flavodoxin family protein [Deltaproteobacteria bacterium Smac51]
MKVMLVNGSPHQHGCTYTALQEIAETLKNEGIESEFFQVGNKPLSGCLGCGKCAELGHCVISDKVNEFTALARQADGFVFGSPVHYAAASGSITSFMDRAFYSGAASGGDAFYLKPAAAIISARRAGTTAAFDQLIKYFTISQMPVISSQYWNMVHGFTPDDVRQDLEGLQTMRVLARNMAWFLKCKEAGQKAGVPLPEKEKRAMTNFIR